MRRPKEKTMHNMYKWRKMTQPERTKTLQQRKQNNNPWHHPPHTDSDANKWYIISAACYEHKHLITPQRLPEVEQNLLAICENAANTLAAWCVLPNHYHLLVQTNDISALRKELGKMHGRTSRSWNLQDNTVGRKTWHNCTERTIKSIGHYWAPLTTSTTTP